VWKLKKFRLPTAVLIVVVGALVTYLLRGGFRRFEIKSYPVPLAAFTNWNDVLAHPRNISLTTFQTGVVHMDACLLVLYHRGNAGCDQARTQECRDAGSEEQMLKEIREPYGGKVVAGHDLDVF
jgi:hypothetical protein